MQNRRDITFTELLDKQLIVVGAGECGKILCMAMSRCGIEVSEIYDNDVNKQDEILLGRGVKNPYELINIKNKKALIILAVGRQHIEELYKQIREIVNSVEIISWYYILNVLAKRVYSTREEKWEIDYEVKFDEWLIKCQSEIKSHFHSMKNKSYLYFEKQNVCKRLDNYVMKNGDMVLDLGSGSALKYGDIINGKRICYVPIDPLAFAYKYGYTKYNLKNPHDIKFAFGEHLSLFFNENISDFVVADNSLDHAINPLRCIIECLRVVKIGGIVSLRHAAVEGRLGYGTGLHQWDMFISESNEFVIGDTLNKINVTNLLKSYVEFDVYEEYDDTFKGPMVIVNMVKKQQISKEILDQYDNSEGEQIVIARLFLAFIDLLELNKYFIM